MIKLSVICLFSMSLTGFSQRERPTWEKLVSSDVDEDAKISKAEFAGKNVENFFKKFDTNSDGFITEDEFSSVAKKGRRSGKGGNKVDNAPAEGSIAPLLVAKKLGADENVNLGEIKKLTVLIFGSYT